MAAPKNFKTEKLNHEKICCYREVYCPEDSCVQLIPKLKLLSHLVQKHPGIQWNPNKWQNRLKITYTGATVPAGPQVKTYFIATMDKCFYSTMVRDRDKRLSYIWVTITGEQEEASRYRCEISVSNKANGKLRFKHSVKPLGDSWKVVIEKGEDIFVLPDSVLLQISRASDTAYLKFTLKLNQPKESYFRKLLRLP